MFIESNIQKMMEFFFNYPLEEFTIREIARRLKIAPPTALRIVNQLKKKRYLIVKKHKHYTAVSSNIEDSTFLDLKKIYNIYSLLRLKNFLVEKLNYPEAIIVYGSYSRGEDTEKSDIDIFILSSTKKDVDVSSYEKSLKREIHIIIQSDFNRVPKEMKSNITNGIALYGGIEC